MAANETFRFKNYHETHYSMTFQFDTFDELVEFSKEMEKNRRRKKNIEIRRRTYAFMREHQIYTYRQARPIIETQFYNDN
jgi:hypothetical protein